MREIKVSVLVYVRNSITYIEKAIRSIMNQTLKEIEILVIDGESTDGTRELIEQLSMEDSRVQLLSSVPGVGRQFNLGLQKAEGEYIGICEADDYLSWYMYEEQYKIAKQYSLDILKADYNRFCEFNGKEAVFPVSIVGSIGLYDCIISPKEDMRVMKAGSQGIWSGLYRREFLLEKQIIMNETEGASYQDMGFSFLATIKANRVMFLKKAYYYYRMDNPNSSENSPRKLTMVTEEYNLLKKRLKAEKLFDSYKEWYFSWKVGALYWFYNRLRGEIQEKYAILMYQDICEELQSEEYSGAELSIECKEVVESVKDSLETMKSHLMQKNGEIYRIEELLENLSENDKIIIFGSGNIGKLLESFMAYTGNKVIAFIDNNEKLWGSKEQEISIMSPHKASGLYPNAIYIIANAIAYHEMKKQLLNLHIDQRKIYICDNYEKILSRLQRAVTQNS